MKVHVLPGDALTESFQKTRIDGELLICRECLVDGDVNAANLDDFWQIRARFIEETHGESPADYERGVKAEFEKLKNLALPEAEINLWFEYELFCQANLWFCLFYLRESEAKIFRVAPVVRENGDVWKGFGNLSAEDLEKCFAARIEFSASDRRLGVELWKAYQASDFETLEKHSAAESACFPFLKEVCRAAIEKNSRPKTVLQEIIANGKTEFAEIFPAFSDRAGVYGFGDAQVHRILAEI